MGQGSGTVWPTIFMAISLLAASGCQGQAPPSACRSAAAVDPDSMQGLWAWEDQSNDGRARTWVLELGADGRYRKFMRAFPNPAATAAVDRYIVDHGTFGRWAVDGGILIEVGDGNFRGSHWDAEKIYTVETDKSPVMFALQVGEATPDRVTLCFPSGELYARWRRVASDYQIPEHRSQLPK